MSHLLPWTGTFGWNCCFLFPGSRPPVCRLHPRLVFPFLGGELCFQVAFAVVSSCRRCMKMRLQRDQLQSVVMSQRRKGAILFPPKIRYSEDNCKDKTYHFKLSNICQNFSEAPQTQIWAALRDRIMSMCRCVKLFPVCLHRTSMAPSPRWFFLCRLSNRHSCAFVYLFHSFSSLPFYIPLLTLSIDGPVSFTHTG